MARIRTIKPSFFQSDDVSALPLRARLTWIGLWTHCDDAGRTKDHARLIKAAIWPLDNVSLSDIEEDLETLADQGRIVRYEVDGQRYLEITNWRAHQAIQKPTPSRIPAPSNVSRNGAGHLPEESDSTTSGKGREGRGREGKGNAREAEPDLPAAEPATPEPPSKCPDHKHLTNPPNCGACADARRAHDTWETERNRRYAAAPKCRIHRGQLAVTCSGCAADRKAGAA